MTPEIHIDMDSIKIRGPLPKEKQIKRYINPVSYDALSDAIHDADITADNNDDGRPDASAWQRVVECWLVCERGAR